MNTRKTSIRPRLARLGLSFALALALALLTWLVVLAAYIRIEGNPIDIEAENDGQMGVWYNNTQQYFGQFAKGSFLFLNGTSLDFDFGNAPAKTCNATYQFTPVTHTLLTTGTVRTVFDAGSYARITQIVEYANGEDFYKITWRIVNTSTQTFTDTRFIHGGDTYFGGYDSARGRWNESAGMIYQYNPDRADVSGIMGLYGADTSPPAHYYEGDFSSNWHEMCSGRLSDSFNTNNIDSGYSLEWDRASLAPGEEWVIVAYEKWTPAGLVQVIAPAGQSGGPEDDFEYPFTILSLESSEDTFSLTATSSLNWDVSIQGSNPITVAAGDTELVTVTVSPNGACGCDTLVLTATSTTSPTVTNFDSLATTVGGHKIYLPLILRERGLVMPNG